MRVTRAPAAGTQIVGEHRQSPRGVDARKARHRAAKFRIKIGFGFLPIRTQKTVCAVMWHRHRNNLLRTENANNLAQWRNTAPVERHDLWKVVVDEPEMRGVWVERQDH